ASSPSSWTWSRVNVRRCHHPALLAADSFARGGRRRPAQADGRAGRGQRRGGRVFAARRRLRRGNRRRSEEPANSDRPLGLRIDGGGRRDQEDSGQMIPARIENVVDLIGGTPLVRLRAMERGLPGIELWGKCEFKNPGGSVKD